MSLYKRIGIETNELLTRYKDAHFHKTCDEKIIITIKSDKGHKCQIKLNKNFPFSTPMVNVDNSEYYIFMQFEKKYLPIMKELYGKKCFCCSSLTCADNWSPNIKLWEIIAELDETSRSKTKIMHVYYCRLIAKMYLTHDLPIELYLR